MVGTIGEILPEAARRFGDKNAVVVASEAISFAELESRSNRIANGLVSIGVGPGDRVTLYGQNCWQWVAAYYAIAKTGAVVNPVSSMLTTEEVRYVVSDAGARVVVTSDDKGVGLLPLLLRWLRRRGWLFLHIVTSCISGACRPGVEPSSVREGLTPDRVAATAGQMQECYTGLGN